MGRRAFVRQRILDAAFDLFASEGFEAVSTRQIAAKAGVGAASMFKHFPTMEDLGRELYRIALEPLQRPFQELVVERPSPGTAIRRCVALLYAAYDERPRALALLIFPPHSFTPPELDPANPEAIRSIVTRLTTSDDTDLAAIIWGAITGPLEDRYLRRRAGAMGPQAAPLAERIVRLLPPPSGATP